MKSGYCLYTSKFFSVCIYLLLSGIPRPCHADISKADLSMEVNTAVTAALQPTVNAIGGPESKTLQRERASEMSQMVLSSNVSSLPDAMGQWIVDSFVSLVKMRAPQLLENNPQSTELMAAIAAQAKARLIDMDDASANVLLARRKSLTDSATQFNQALRQYIFAQFSSCREVDLIMTLPQRYRMHNDIDDHDYDHFEAVFYDLDYPTLALNDVCDLRKLPVREKLLALTWIYQLNMNVIESSMDAKYSFGNLFSKVFDKENMDLHIDNFEQSKSRIAAHIGATFRPADNSVEVDYNKLCESVRMATNLRMDVPTSQVDEHTNTKAPTIIIKIANSPEYWKMLAAGDF